MEGLRGIAVMMVFVCHYDVLIRQNLAVPDAIARIGAVLGRMGTAGVDLFFLLSGFLIYRSAIRPDLHYGRFLVRRAVRIYPAFLAVFALYCGLLFMLPSLGRSVGHGWTETATNVAMNLAFLPGFVNVQPIVTVAWSLSYEWYFYLVSPLVVRALRMRQWSRSSRVAFIVTAGILYLCTGALGPELSEFLSTPIYRFHIRLVMFLVGIAAWEMLESRRLQAYLSFIRVVPFRVFAAVLGLCALFLAEALHGEPSVVSINQSRFEALRCVVLIVVFLPTALATLGPASHAPLLTVPELRWLGNVSYSYYLAHTLALNALKVIVVRSSLLQANPLISLVLLLPVAFVLTVVAAAVLFTLVERPFSLRGTERPRPGRL
jgi:peptidoglycan/LPS O-acetylase OafA/YrhL